MVAEYIKTKQNISKGQAPCCPLSRLATQTGSKATDEWRLEAFQFCRVENL
jgi:hypothetical protein